MSDQLSINGWYTGGRLCGDEKLFRITGSSGWVCMCLNKPGSMGSGVIRCFLEMIFLFLARLHKAHLAPSAMDMTEQIHSMIGQTLCEASF